MKRLGTFFVLIALPIFAAMASDYNFYEDGYKETNDSSVTTFQVRAGVDFEKKFRSNIAIGVSEELRFTFAPWSYASVFDRSFTTLSFSYTPIQYVKLDAGYMLKIVGATTPEKWKHHWSDANEFIKHRMFFSVSGQVKLGQFKLALRERALVDMRTDSINPLEKNAADWTLRHRLLGEYAFRSLPMKVYTWVELANTLNATDYQKKYKNNDPVNNKGHQYLERVRWEAGMKWRFNQHQSINVFYRLDYGYSRDVNVTKGAGKAELTELRTTQNAIGVTYNFNL